MIDFINNTDIFVLLGLEELPEEEKNKYTDDMGRRIVGNILQRLENDLSIPIEKQARLKELIEDTSEAPEVDEELLSDFPQVSEYMDNEVYIFKKTAISDQLEMLKNKALNLQDQSAENNFANIVSQLKNLLTRNSDEENQFESLWKNFSSITNNIT